MTHVRAEAARSTRNVAELINMRYEESHDGCAFDSTFSREQMQAITHVNGSMLVIAGPGSGKTTVITARIKYLIESAGVSPADILVITFTRAAAREMENRFRKLTQGRDYRVRFGTFHSVFFWIIKTAYNLSNSSIISEEEKRKIADSLMRDMSMEYENKEDVISSILAQISIVKCDMIDIGNYYSRDMPEHAFRELFHRMGQEMRRRKKIDFDDMMVMCYELLTERRDILDRCRRIFRYIMVDEFQDSNRLQYEIFKLLAMPAGNVFAVGDDDQSVYGFRGARPEIMQQFQRDFPKCRQVLLCENYRCDRRISGAASALIGGNKNRFDKAFTARSTEDGTVKIIRTRDGGEQNELLLQELRGHFSRGIPYERQAVLYRTNIQPRRLVYKLDSYNIPYCISDSMPNIFEHFAVRNVLDYIRVALGDHTRAAFLRIMNKPGRYISRDMLYEDPVDYDRLRYRLRDKEYALDKLDKLTADLGMIRRLRPYPALNYIRRFVGYEDYLREYAEYRQMDEGELIDVLDEFASMLEDMTSYGELFEFIEEYSDIVAKQQPDNKNGAGVKLMTMHSAKGLEFDCVYIIDAVEGITPHKKAKLPGELEEERRMFYVAMTRAKHELQIYVPKLSAGKAKDESRFISDVERALQ